MLEKSDPTLLQGGGDPLVVYYDGIRDAPVPARLMAETPPEAFVRRLVGNLAWASAAMALVLILTALPTPVDPAAAEASARDLSYRLAMREIFR